MWKFSRKTRTGHELNRTLSRPHPRSIRLLSELTETGAERPRILLMTSPVGQEPAALAAGDLTAAALDMGVPRVRLIDLRREGDRFTPGDMARQADVYYPNPALVADAPRFQEWVRELAATAGLAILLCGGVLDPKHWSEDPVAWATVDPLVILATREGQSTEVQVADAADRMRRKGLEIAGGILVTGRPRGVGITAVNQGLVKLGLPRNLQAREGLA